MVDAQKRIEGYIAEGSFGIANWRSWTNAADEGLYMCTTRHVYKDSEGKACLGEDWGRHIRFEE